MTYEQFEEKLENGLDGLDEKSKDEFALRCLLRALPFIGVKGNFDFWIEENRLAYLYTLFSSIDILFGKINLGIQPTDNYLTSEAQESQEDALISIRATLSIINDLVLGVLYDIRMAARAAALAALDCKRRYCNELNVEGFYAVIISDLDNPREYQKYNYGQIWNSFIMALRNEGCDYWADLYTDIFDNNLTVNEKDLKLRLFEVPDEFIGLGADEIGKFIIRLKSGDARKLNEARLIILGEKGSGKTSLARRLQNPICKMPNDYESTPGVNTDLWQPVGKDINIRIWDFAGHTVTHAVHKFFLSERCLYVLVYDGRTEERNRVQYWLEHVKRYGRDSKVYILINIKDKHTPGIDKRRLKEKYPNIIEFVEFSIKDDQSNLQNFTNRILDDIVNNPSWNNKSLPKEDFDVKEKLLKMFEIEAKEYIRIKDFKELCNDNNSESLLKSLHCLGVGLWYPDLKKYDTMVLNPEWISNGIYKIINWVDKNKRHLLKLNDLADVYNKFRKRYPKEKDGFFYDLMIKYELAYSAPKKECLVIPHLLSRELPENLPKFEKIEECLIVRYKWTVELLPETISRFIVRVSNYIKYDIADKPVVWRDGVVLEKDNVIAMVRLDDRIITVSVKGKGRKEYLQEIRKTMDDLLDIYKDEKPDFEYFVKEYGEIGKVTAIDKPFYEKEETLKAFAEEGLEYFEPTSRKKYSADKIVNQFIKVENGASYFNKVGNYSSLEDSHDINTTNNFNFSNCNIDLQGDLNSLAKSLETKGLLDEAIELKETKELLKDIENSNDPKEVQRSGILKRMDGFLEEVSNEESKLHKTVKGIKKGVSTVQDIAKTYNDIAQWCGLPQVPKPFLKKGER